MQSTNATGPAFWVVLTSCRVDDNACNEFFFFPLHVLVPQESIHFRWQNNGIWAQLEIRERERKRNIKSLLSCSFSFYLFSCLSGGHSICFFSRRCEERKVWQYWSSVIWMQREICNGFLENEIASVTFLRWAVSFFKVGWRIFCFLSSCSITQMYVKQRMYSQPLNISHE